MAKELVVTLSVKGFPPERIYKRELDVLPEDVEKVLAKLPDALRQIENDIYAESHNA